MKTAMEKWTGTVRADWVEGTNVRMQSWTCELARLANKVRECNIVFGCGMQSLRIVCSRERLGKHNTRVVGQPCAFENKPRVLEPIVSALEHLSVHLKFQALEQFVSFAKAT